MMEISYFYEFSIYFNILKQNFQQFFFFFFLFYGHMSTRMPTWLVIVNLSYSAIYENSIVNSIHERHHTPPPPPSSFWRWGI